jgi:hypothetical protein
MKSCIIIIWLVVIWLGIMLSSCTETIIDEIIKLDTVYINTPRSVSASVIVTHDTVVIRDTVEVRVIVHDTIINTIHTTDTLIQVVTRDSIIIREVEKLVTVYDTIIQNFVDTVYVTDTVEIRVVQIEQRVLYLDTLYVLVESRQVFYVPDELMPYVSDFYTLAGQYGQEALGGMLLITYAKEEDLPGELWTSTSFRHGWDYSQMIIQISEEVPSEQARSCIYRELARLQLKRKYTTTPDRIMNPLFNIDAVITTNHLDQLFNQNPI